MLTSITRGLKERDMTNHKPKPMGTKTSKPPRTRDGKNFPGGRHLRRALKNLSARQNSFVAATKGHQQTKPGSMAR